MNNFKYCGCSRLNGHVSVDFTDITDADDTFRYELSDSADPRIREALRLHQLAVNTPCDDDDDTPEQVSFADICKQNNITLAELIESSHRRQRSPLILQLLRFRPTSRPLDADLGPDEFTEV